MNMQIEITPPRLFLAILAIFTLVLWSLGLCGKLTEAMHAQAMEYNEVYTGDNVEGEEDTEGDSKLPQLKRRTKAA